MPRRQLLCHNGPLGRHGHLHGWTVLGIRGKFLLKLLGGDLCRRHGFLLGGELFELCCGLIFGGRLKRLLQLHHRQLSAKHGAILLCELCSWYLLRDDGSFGRDDMPRGQLLHGRLRRFRLVLLGDILSGRRKQLHELLSIDLSK
jgi:hypothetical protein